MTMIIARELDNFVAPSVSTCEAQSTHASFRPTIDEANHLNTRDKPNHFLCQFILDGCWSAVACTVQNSRLQGFHHRREGMSQDKRPPRKHIIQQLVIIHIIEICPCASCNHTGSPAHTAKGSHR